MDRIGDAFAWPFRDPEWVNKILVMGLILLIPVAGGINGLGWMLAALERLRAGDERLPPANFDYLERGFRLFVVLFVYYLHSQLNHSFQPDRWPGWHDARRHIPSA